MLGQGEALGGGALEELNGPLVGLGHAQPVGHPHRQFDLRRPVALGRRQLKPDRAAAAAAAAVAAEARRGKWIVKRKRHTRADSRGTHAITHVSTQSRT